MKSDSLLELLAADMLEDPDRVMNLASQKPVRVIRPGGEPLLLGTDAGLDADHVGVAEGVTVMSAYLEGAPRSLSRSFTGQFPWMVQLTQRDRDACIDELITTARTGAAAHDFGPLAIAVDAWRDTAELRPYADKVKNPPHWFAPE